MDVRVPADRLLIPHEPFPDSRTRASHEAWTADRFVCDLNHHCGLRVNAAVLEERKRQFPRHAAFLDALAADLRARLPHFGGYSEYFVKVSPALQESVIARTEHAGVQAAFSRCGRPRAAPSKPGCCPGSRA